MTLGDLALSLSLLLGEFDLLTQVGLVGFYETFLPKPPAVRQLLTDRQTKHCSTLMRPFGFIQKLPPGKNLTPKSGKSKTKKVPKIRIIYVYILIYIQKRRRQAVIH